ncbi:unnamed protein product [Arabidopsis arenosa]|uniref:Uncharacterized protein n=2 Tax=Arabidopsis arenosa TaxID=38785 RepID=A0A8S1ZT00_ARAAE|nr:unnamed protein product [Arabidopsis arenosa]
MEIPSQEIHIMIDNPKSRRKERKTILADAEPIVLMSILSSLHAGYFRISLSLCSQALLWKIMVHLHSELPSMAYYLLWYLALATQVSLCFLYALKCIFLFDMVKEEFLHYIGVNYLYAPSISCLLLLQSAPMIEPHSILYQTLFWIFAVPVLTLDTKLYGQWFTTEKRFLSIMANPASQVSVIANLVAARGAAEMGWKECALCLFSLGMVHYLVIFVTLYQRLPGGNNFPTTLRPVFFLFFAAPATASLAWNSICGTFDIIAKMLFFLSLFIFMSLVCRPNLLKKSIKRFNVAWWAYSFPITFLALDSVQYAQEQQTAKDYSDVIMSSVSSSLGFRATNKELNQMIRSGYIAEAREIFEKLEARNTVTWNTMISGYVKRREMTQARKLFDEMPERDVVTWNAMISGYVSCGGIRFLEEARKLFDEMPSRDSFSWNTMISGYAKNRRISEALLLFEKMPERNAVSWSAMITGFCHNGEVNRAFELFRRMPVKDSSSLCALVAGLIKNERLEEAAWVLGQYGCLDSGREDLVYAYNTLIVGYGQRGQVEAARCLFDQIPDLCDDVDHGGAFRERFRRNVVSWNSMIKAYLKVGDVVSARLLFDQMKDRDTISWNTMIDGYVHVSRMEDAFALFSEMPNRDAHSWNMMVSGYASVGNLELARHYFERTPEKNIVSWNSIIAAYDKNKDYKEAVDVFMRMNIDGEKPDPHTLTSLLSVSTGLVNLRLGMQMHQIVVKTVIPDVPVHNALITMYSRCGEIMESRRIFDEMKLKREVITWNAMIGGYAFHGNASEALNLFWSMKSNGIHPSHITFVSVLNACAHAGLVDEAKAQFVSMMSVYKIEPQMEHYSSLVNVISGQGQFEEAMYVIKSMPFEPDKTVWGALLDACRIYNNVGLAHVAAEAMSRLEPESSTPYVLLYNMYADMGLWDEASQVRMNMESKRIKKERGSSWVDSST